MATRRVAPGHLFARWSKREKDVLYSYPSKPDGSLLSYALGCVKILDGKTLLEELEARGYDVTTLRFSIKRKAGG